RTKKLSEKIDKIDKKLDIIENLTGRVDKLEKFILQQDEEITSSFEKLTDRINIQDELINRAVTKIINFNFEIFKELSNEILDTKKRDSIKTKMIEFIEHDLKEYETQHFYNSRYNHNFDAMNDESLRNKKLLLENFLKDNYFDIFCLNETKLTDSCKIEFSNYKSLYKNRNSRGGGVGILIRNGIEFEVVECFNRFNLEILAVKVKLKNCSIHIIAWYLPPDNTINKEFNSIPESLFNSLSQIGSFVLVGDLNCHSSKWFCSKTSTKGQLLSSLIEKHDLNVLNSNISTIQNENAKCNRSVIDLMIISNDLSDKFNFFKVFGDNLTSDHFPIKSSFNIETIEVMRQIRTINKTSWSQFKDNVDRHLMANDIFNQANQDIDNLYNEFNKSILSAQSESTISKTRRPGSKTLPKYLLDIIFARKKMLKKLRKFPKNVEYNQTYNRLSKVIKLEIKAIQEKMWINFCESINKTKTSSAEYWRKIKQITKLEDNTGGKKIMPELKYKDTSVKTSREKAQVFGEILKKVFSEQQNNNFDENHKQEIDSYVREKRDKLFVTKQGDEVFDDDFSIAELDE
ncbi:unnamed protein product, partial [Brachionus calyciflorus]